MSNEQLKQELLQYFDDNMFTKNIEIAKQLGEINLVRGMNLTKARLAHRDALGIIHYYWSAVYGTDNSIKFSNEMKRCGLVRFEDLLEDFRVKFGNTTLNSIM